MAATTIEAVLEALEVIIDPDLGRDIVTLGFVKPEDVRIDDGHVGVEIHLTTPACPVKDRFRQQATDVIAALEGVSQVSVKMSARTASNRHPSQGQVPLPGVKNVLAVGSGKGGVGKSTVAVNLAHALLRMGATVGILDADIYGPSLPILLGLRGRQPKLTADQKIEPIERDGLKVMSMGFLIPDHEAVVWRGPMLGKALEQFVRDVDWGELDYLIVDLPPGTGDVQLTLAQSVSTDGAVVVTTPQDVAFADVRRAIRMFRKTKVPVLGLVENMAYFTCPDNGKTYHIFGEGKTEAQAAEHGLPFLGQLPLDMQVGPAADRGELIADVDPEGEQARLYNEMAGRVAAELSKRHLLEPGPKSTKGSFQILG